MSVIHSSSSILCCSCHCYVRQVQFFVFCPSHCYVCQVQFVCCPCHWYVRQVQFIYYQYQKWVRPIPVLKNQNLEWILSKHNGHLAFLHNVSQPLLVADFLGWCWLLLEGQVKILLGCKHYTFVKSHLVWYDHHMFHLGEFHSSMNSREYLQKAGKAALPHFSYVLLDNQLLLHGVGLHCTQSKMNEGNMLLH